MGMIPARKRPLQLAVAKLPTGCIIPMFDNPDPRKRTGPQAQDDPRAVLSPPAPLHDLDRLPGGARRSKAPGRVCQAKTSSAEAEMRERRVKIGMGYGESIRRDAA